MSTASSASAPMTGGSPTEADLEAIVAAVRNRDYAVSEHALARGSDPARPGIRDVVAGIAEDFPRIVGDDRGQHDPRGAVATIECENRQGRTLRVRVNYSRRPIVLVTQFWRDADYD